MNLRKRIVFSFGGIIVLFGMAVAVYLWTAVLRNQTMESLDRALKRQVLISAVRQDVDNLHKQVAILGEMDFGSGMSATSPEVRRSFAQHTQEVADRLKELETLTDESEQAQIHDIQNTYQQLSRAWKGFYEYLGVEQAWALANILKADPLSMRLQTELLPNFEKAEQQRVRRAEERFKRVQKLTFRLSIAIFLVSGMLATGVAFAITRHIGHGFKVLKHGTDVIGNMNLEHRIVWPGEDELGDFARSFNEMADRLAIARDKLQWQAEEIARRQQHELELAATIQQGLMQVRMPDIPFAKITGKNLSCTQIGGDFFDVVNTTEGLAVIIADVSGKGISAAIMASLLQGMIRSELAAHQPLHKLLENVNWFLTQRDVGGKYATLSVLRVTPCGEVEYVNCGHIPPVLIRNNKVMRLDASANVPVGLLENMTFDSASFTIQPGDRIIMVTDGVTEASNSEDEFFGEDRLEKVAANCSSYETVFEELHRFCAGTPFNDDCTVVELSYSGEMMQAARSTAVRAAV
ncbi:MAG TPA: SpoIIE family protein phosphatase [Terriglobales bacterium]|nr:SpoIIE family protein phosphatase [Terriglobales bacterium]